MYAPGLTLISDDIMKLKSNIHFPVLGPWTLSSLHVIVSANFDAGKISHGAKHGEGKIFVPLSLTWTVNYPLDVLQSDTRLPEWWNMLIDGGEDGIKWEI